MEVIDLMKITIIQYVYRYQLFYACFYETMISFFSINVPDLERKS